MIRIDCTSVSLVALVMTVGSLTPSAASGQTSPGPSSFAADPRIASAQGKEVRITAMDGSRRKARLVSLSASEVVFQDDGRNLTMGLGDVRKVERVSHGVRNGAIYGAIEGFVIGYLTCREADDCRAEVMGAMVAGMGAAAGAGIGAIVNSAKAQRNLLYQMPAASGSVSLSPILSPRRQGVVLTTRW